MGTPLVSVIIPAYNHEKFIGPAIDSVLNQSLTDWELVIVDDGSTDGTAAVIKQYDDPRIQYHYQENQDAYNALNKGMSLATGEWLAILNSDDCYQPDRLQRCLDAASDADVVFTGVNAIDDNGNRIPEEGHYWHLWHQRNLQVYLDSKDLYAAFLRGNLLITTSNLVMRAEVAKRVGGFAPLRYLHDYDYMFRLLLACPDRVCYLHDQSLMNYRIHGSNTLKQGALKARHEDVSVIRKYATLGVPEASRYRVDQAFARMAELDRELQMVSRGLRWGRFQPLANAVFKVAKGMGIVRS
jgi:glycosyltransferase involved in cell wall biosynthesis